MKNEKELNGLKEEVNVPNGKQTALTDEELEQVNGGGWKPPVDLPVAPPLPPL